MAKDQDILKLKPRTEKVKRLIEVGKATRFQKGTVNNPAGRPKGSVTGLKKARLLIDDLLKKNGNLGKVVKALQQAFDKDPLGFMDKYCALSVLTRDMTRPNGSATVESEDGKRAIAIHIATAAPEEPED